MAEMQPKSHYSEAFADYVRSLLKLHELMASGKDDERGDEVRDRMDAPWVKMTPNEREIADAISADLYTLSDDNVIRHPIQSGVYAQDLAAQLTDASKDHRWLQTLDLLRSRSPDISADRAAALRYLCYRELDLRDIASLFLQRAAHLSPPGSEHKLMLIIDLLDRSQWDEALTSIDAVLSGPGGMPIQARLALSAKLSRMAPLVGEEHASRFIISASRLLSTLDSHSIPDAALHLRSQHVLAWHLLSIAYNSRHDVANALLSIGKAIKLAPEDGTSYALRGHWRLNNRDEKGAESDFEQAVALHTPYSSPYIYLASSAFRRGDFDRSLMLVSAAIPLMAPGRDVAHAYHFMAVCLNLLGAPDAIVEEQLERAVNNAPNETRLRDSLESFRLHAFNTQPMHTWEQSYAPSFQSTDIERLVREGAAVAVASN